MSIEAMKLALEALEEINKLSIGENAICLPAEIDTAMDALRQAIEQSQQAEPDYYGLTKDHLWMSITKDHYDRLKPEFRMACYTSPPLRQPLMDEEIQKLLSQNRFAVFALVRAVEAAHGIKENT